MLLTHKEGVGEKQKALKGSERAGGAHLRLDLLLDLCTGGQGCERACSAACGRGSCVRTIGRIVS